MTHISISNFCKCSKEASSSLLLRHYQSTFPITTMIKIKTILGGRSNPISRRSEGSYIWSILGHGDHCNSCCLKNVPSLRFVHNIVGLLRCGAEAADRAHDVRLFVIFKCLYSTARTFTKTNLRPRSFTGAAFLTQPELFDLKLHFQMLLEVSTDLFPFTNGFWAGFLMDNYTIYNF